MANYSWFLALIDVLACYRLTRLIVKDSLFQEARWWVLRRWPSELTTFPESIVTKDEEYPNRGWLTEPGPALFKTEDGEWVAEGTYKLTELLECGWCASLWVATGVVALRSLWDWWQYPALVLALSALASLILSLADND